MLDKDDRVQLASITSSSLESTFCLSNLGQLYWFTKFIDDAKAECSGSKLVMCTGRDYEAFTACAFLLGGYLIVHENVSLDHLSAIFEPVSGLFQVFQDCTQSISVCEGLTVHDGWRAISRAKTNGWLNFQDEETDIDSCIDMQEYQHYDNQLNGFLHVIIPSRLIAFQCPSNLSDIAADNNGQWLDSEGQRFFGPAFYADILGGDFGVQVVVRCDREDDECDQDDTSDDEEGELATTSSGYDESAFALRGLAVERLAVPRDGVLPSSALLHDVDRFLTLARLAPGPVAIHGGAGLGLGCGGELLVSSLLIKRYGFDARSAIAWVRATHAAVTPRSFGLSLVPRPAAPVAAAQRPHASLTRRASAPAILPCPEAPAAAAEGGCEVVVAGAGCVKAAAAPRLLSVYQAFVASAPDVFGGLGLNRTPVG